MTATTDLEDREDGEDVARFLELGRIDWYVGRSSNRLHYAELNDEHRAAIPEYWGVPGPVRLCCGRTAAFLSIPGIFTRMGAMRCTGCCKALGYPQGKGSPKNDDACRVLLGLEVSQ